MVLGRIFALVAALVAGGASATAASAGVAALGCLDADVAACDAEGMQLVQMRGTKVAAAENKKTEANLAFMHIPYNFGHTVERVSLLGPNSRMEEYVQAYLASSNNTMSVESRSAIIDHMKVKGGEVWGRLNPEFNDMNNKTGCIQAFSPAKYWPEDLAEKYFGGKTVFGMLRDPYERLVSLFRGSIDGYGGNFAEFLETCDVNGAVKQMMRDYKAGGKFDDGCTYVPQAEFFEGKHGVKLAVDNRLFPASFNELMTEQGYDAIHAATSDLIHVIQCTQVWAGDLDCEARALVQEVYADDFKLLCERFGYCDTSENTCISGVPEMCPDDTSKKNTHC